MIKKIIFNDTDKPLFVLSQILRCYETKDKLIRIEFWSKQIQIFSANTEMMLTPQKDTKTVIGAIVGAEDKVEELSKYMANIWTMVTGKNCEVEVIEEKN